MTEALPFKQRVSIGARGASPDAVSVPCSIWPARTRLTNAGTTYDHEAEIPLGYAPLVQDANVVITDDAGTRLRRGRGAGQRVPAARRAADPPFGGEPCLRRASSAWRSPALPTTRPSSHGTSTSSSARSSATSTASCAASRPRSSRLQVRRARRHRGAARLDPRGLELPCAAGPRRGRRDGEARQVRLPRGRLARATSSRGSCPASPSA